VSDLSIHALDDGAVTGSPASAMYAAGGFPCLAHERARFYD
jgi:hypothetical protein